MNTTLRMRDAKTIKKRNKRVIEFSSCCGKRIMKYAKPKQDGKKTIIGRCSDCGKEKEI